MPLTVAAGIDMPRLAIGEALGTPIPDGPLPFEDLAMVRYFEERFFAFDEIADLQGVRGRHRLVNPRQDMHVHSTFSDGRDPIEGNVDEAEALGLTAAHVRRPRARGHGLGARRTSPRCGGSAQATDVELRCGIEAKLLDTTGALDLPGGLRRASTRSTRPTTRSRSRTGRTTRARSRRGSSAAS